jgi:uncharacterized RDD family membrane protein YckC
MPNLNDLPEQEKAKTDIESPDSPQKSFMESIKEAINGILTFLNKDIYTGPLRYARIISMMLVWSFAVFVAIWQLFQYAYDFWFTLLNRASIALSVSDLVHVCSYFFGSVFICLGLLYIFRYFLLPYFRFEWKDLKSPSKDKKGTKEFLKQEMGIDFSLSEGAKGMLQEANLSAATIPRRFQAYFIDVAITLISAALIIAMAKIPPTVYGVSTRGDRITITFVFWALAVFPIYYGFFALIFGKTIGCWISNINVIKMNGKRIGFATGLLRGFLMGVITAMIFPATIVGHTAFSLLGWGGKTKPGTAGWDIATWTIVVQKIKEKKISNAQIKPDAEEEQSKPAA